MNPSYFTDAKFDLHLTLNVVGTNLNHVELQTKLSSLFNSKKDDFQQDLLYMVQRHLNFFGPPTKMALEREFIDNQSVENIELKNFNSHFFFSPTHRTLKVSYEMVGEESEDKYIPDPRYKKEENSDELTDDGFLKIYYIEGEMYYKNKNDKSFCPLMKL